MGVGGHILVVPLWYYTKVHKNKKKEELKLGRIF